MKKKLLVFAAIFVVLAMVILLSRGPASPPHVELGFLGFTNSGPRLIALFGISNHPPLAVDLDSITHLDTNASNAGDVSGSWDWGSSWEPWGILCAIGVKTTNEPLRVVFEFQQRAVGLRRIPEVVQERWGTLTGKGREFFTGSKFLVTNQTSIVKVPH
jgi:hypothetical protein